MLSGCSVPGAESGPLTAASIARELHSAEVGDFPGGFSMSLEESGMAGAWSGLAAASSVRVRHGGKPKVQQGRSTLALDMASSGMYMGTNMRKQSDKGIESGSRLLVSTFGCACALACQAGFLTIAQGKGLSLLRACMC